MRECVSVQLVCVMLTSHIQHAHPLPPPTPPPQPQTTHPLSLWAKVQGARVALGLHLDRLLAALVARCAILAVIHAPPLQRGGGRQLGRVRRSVVGAPAADARSAARPKLSPPPHLDAHSRVVVALLLLSAVGWGHRGTCICCARAWRGLSAVNAPERRWRTTTAAPALAPHPAAVSTAQSREHRERALNPVGARSPGASCCLPALGAAPAFGLAIARKCRAAHLRLSEMMPGTQTRQGRRARRATHAADHNRASVMARGQHPSAVCVAGVGG